MQAEERRLSILNAARSAGTVAVTDLAWRFKVAKETVRRDLALLEKEGLIRRTHGGARPVESTRFMASPPPSVAPHTPARARIATAAVGLLGEAGTVFVDEGLTGQLIARALPRDRDLTVVTASLAAAHALGDAGRITVLLLGGQVRHTTLATGGREAVRMLRGFVTDLAYLSADGVSRDRGLTVSDPAVAALKTQVVRGSRRRVLTVAHLAFGGLGPCRFAGVHDMEAIVTTAGLPPVEAQRYALLGPRVLSV
ncbi:transcriptional regulator [Streptomyces inusitatus]|uniref:Lactose phosphotransferase system repressor n=1 Tax=Streptomyces inusitatus TaxID=68221 RepID=A0A918QKT2_9ACTN|nr:DeoR/GlpR family DNA-binding transcription regulator [Streptomyces inusitatus]GGZ51335.1 transcriptional regulator [Streptomyces inusitatus]